MKSLCLLAAILGCGLSAAAQTIQVNRENRTISVTATEKVTVLADIASVHIGFVAYGPDQDTAYAVGARISNAIHAALTGAGVQEKAIESENQTLGPVPEYSNSPLTPVERQQRKFQVNQSWTVRSNATDAAKVLDLAVKAGANQSGQIGWSLQDENAPEAEAAAKALQRAHNVADQMARGLNAKLGALIFASNETQAEPIRPYEPALAMKARAAAPVAPLAINPRQVEKFATVRAIFAIE